ncbi:hypothetical protein CK203_091540 [Vitis vinifera]|uniref:Reverse transcriptase RNase H-like domain-containing protein n=1 Tax=Vitis vinifera TaxID=29760 RepID=A0A438ECS5_VITVI|nr:hypothetical protein CK203_091540 [Vitis vinifera]
MPPPGIKCYPFWMLSPGITKIPMTPRDEEKTVFITPHGLYCYKVMSFGFKNVGATYQRLMTKIFKPLIGDVVELNPAKCAFGVSSGKFLGFMVTQRGIEINLDQVKAVANMLAPTNKKQLQRLTGKLVASRTVHSSIHKQNEAFLPGTQRWERLYLYLAVTDWVVNAVLLRSLSPREQRPVYFISKTLADAETRYSRMEHTALALRTATQKLCPYFQAHPIIVLTNQPLRNTLHKPDITGMMLRWAIETKNRIRMIGGLCMLIEPPARPDQESDSSSKCQPANGLEQSIRLDFPASNNEAEYKAILSELGLATTLNASKVKIHSDFQPVMGQILKSTRPRTSADALARIAASFPVKKSTMIPVYVQITPTIAESHVCNVA